MEPRRVDPLLLDLGARDGHRLVVLSLEVYDDWADLRFARIDDGTTRPLPRRIPATEAWTVTVDGTPAQVDDSVGRGDRMFSNGEARLRPPPPPGASLEISVALVPGAAPLTGRITLPD